MSPELRTDGRVIADVPDRTGTYKTKVGKPLYVNVDLIDADKDIQRIILDAEEIGGRRVIGLTQEGRGYSWDRKRGDDKSPAIEVVLRDRPIRVSYHDREWIERKKTLTLALAGSNGGGYWNISTRTYKNPRWKGRGQR